LAPSATPTLALPTATATLTPPATRAAPSLLKPTLGQSFAAGSNITLEWTAVGELGPAEFYRVTVEDLTCNCNRRYTTASTQTSLALPPNLRPTEATAHIFSWTVETVRQTGTASDGQANYEAIGATSAVGTFTWTGTARLRPEAVTPTIVGDRCVYYGGLEAGGTSWCAGRRARHARGADPHPHHHAGRNAGAGGGVL
jgi:hypothetical protein